MTRNILFDFAWTMQYPNPPFKVAPGGIGSVSESGVGTGGPVTHGSVRGRRGDVEQIVIGRKNHELRCKLAWRIDGTDGGLMKLERKR